VSAIGGDAEGVVLPAAGVIFDRVGKSFGERTDRTVALDGVTLSVPRGHFVTLIGPSGCGKSTLLRIASGLVDADSGTVAIFGESVAQAKRHKRIGFVPQSPALLPWRSVLENVTLPLEVNRRDHGAGRRDPVALLQAVGLGDVLDRRPDQLSGGMQQRVAIARAFVHDPSLLVMDEPFSALDELTREVVRRQLLDLWAEDQKTVLFVTHSVQEAVLLSDVVVVMSTRPGRVRALVPVALPRPRDESVEFGEAFGEIEREVRSELRAGWVDGRP
jgi:NitT/TauT family transport system ATP-binding protein